MVFEPTLPRAFISGALPPLTGIVLGHLALGAAAGEVNWLLMTASMLAVALLMLAAAPLIRRDLAVRIEGRLVEGPSRLLSRRYRGEIDDIDWDATLRSFSSRSLTTRVRFFGGEYIRVDRLVFGAELSAQLIDELVASRRGA